MTPKTPNDRPLSRREATGSILALLGGAFVACAGGSREAGDGSSTSSGGGSEGGTTPSGSSAPWASGGTKSMTKSYPSPFPLAGAACVVLASATEGPCTEAEDRERQDISEGFSGLPVRLALRIVDGGCRAIAGAKVKVWHTQVNGSYSGDTPNDAMCVATAADGERHCFRGVQTTDADGRVDFDTCFPGWYRGRTIHIHFTVTLQSGTAFTSQLVFAQSLVREIFASHAEYTPYGQPDTDNDSDGIVGDGFTLVTSRLEDGAMMAAKEIRVG